MSVPPSQSTADTAGVPITYDPFAPPEKREAQAQMFVNQKLRLWQERLDLMDWSIEATLVRRDSLKPRTLGGVHWDTSAKKASIDVKSTYDYKLSPKDMLDDMEVTVVHELVHLHLSSLPRSEATSRAEEKAVVELAAALIRLSKR